MTQTADITALLRACTLQPDEDTPRLVLSDALDEVATTDAERARAELIRVQMELVKCHPTCGVGKVCRGVDSPYGVTCGAVRDREAELIRTYAATWRRPPCPACKGNGSRMEREPHQYGDRHKAECDICKGDGSTGVLSEVTEWIGLKHQGYAPIWKHDVTYVRGLPVVTVPFADMGAAGYTSALGEIPWDWNPEWLAWACRAVREEGASFAVTGREPQAWRHEDEGEFVDVHGWGLYPSYHRSGLPPEIWEEVAKEADEIYAHWADFRTPTLARAALDAAVSRIVTRKAWEEQA